MNTDLMQSQAQPFMKLTQANLDLVMRFATSPAVIAETNQAMSEMFQRSGESAMKLMQSGASAQLMQGLVKNYTEFLTELGRSSAALIGQGGTAWVQQMQSAAESATRQVGDAADARGRRNRTTA